MRILLTALAAVLYVLGWTAGKAWAALAWLATAVLVGFRDGAAPKPASAPELRRPEPGVPVRPAA